MPISIVVGGQFGSEGKGKVALEMVRRDHSTTLVVRPGGTNSGHTAYNAKGERLVVRQLPAAAIDGNVRAVFPPGCYIDVDLLMAEIERSGVCPSQVVVDPAAHIIRPQHIAWERAAGLINSIGSTGSGTGAAVISRVARYAGQQVVGITASEIDVLQPFLADTADIMAKALKADERILIEGTQGFGLSLYHSGLWPQCTSRDTTAAGFLSETGLSPRYVDRIVLVLRCHPIRVAGDSGPLPNEVSWETIAAEAGVDSDFREFTSVTNKLRRVGRFSSDVVRRAIRANSPTQIVLNHLDYIDPTVRERPSEKAGQFLTDVERSIGMAISWVGTDDRSIRPTEAAMAS